MFPSLFSYLRKRNRKNVSRMSNWGDKRLWGRGIIALQSFLSQSFVANRSKAQKERKEWKENQKLLQATTLFWKHFFFRFSFLLLASTLAQSCSSRDLAFLPSFINCLTSSSCDYLLYSSACFFFLFITCKVYRHISIC